MKKNKPTNNTKLLIWITIISIFPEMFKAFTSCGIIGQAIKKNLIRINLLNPRDFSTDKHRKIDNRPYGGGPGMIMSFLPLKNSIKQAKLSFNSPSKVIYLSPQGKKLNKKNILQLTKNSKLILICGRYEGIDERLFDNEIDEEWSIGDYVLSGGELPAMVLIDVLLRFIPGILGKETSAKEDSFYNGLLDHPHYTRPQQINNLEVPKTLLSGNHALIKQWRLKESLGKTWIKRPDLLKKINLTPNQCKLLKIFKIQFNKK